MGERGPIALATSTRENRDRVAVQTNIGLSFRPAPDSRWSEEIQGEWNTYLDSDVAKSITDVDFNALKRLFGYYHAYAIASDVLLDQIIDKGADALVDTGSRGQEQASGLVRVLEKFEKLMAPLEGRFGVSPLLRARLGIEVGTAIKTGESIGAGLADRDRPDEM